MTQARGDDAPRFSPGLDVRYPHQANPVERAAMDDTLQRLLAAELRAETIASQAEEEQERIIQQAMADAKADNERFTARIPDLHRGFIARAEERAEQNIAELRRRYDERHVLLRDQAEQREDEALESAFQVLIDPGR
jgi:V/A-type H+/Na+-transporting ATPase subunit G/H